MTTPVYATREDVMRALDTKLTARNAAQIDRQLQAASRDVDKLCHRRFYPEQATRYFDWPSSQYGTAWRLWLDDSELIEVTAVSSGGTSISTSDVLLEPNRSGPPYSRLELNIGSDAAFGGGDTHQRDISVTGLWGYTNDETPAGALAAAVADSTVTTVTVDAAGAAAVGVGSVIRIGDERLLVTGRTMAYTGQTLATALDAQAKTVTVEVADGTAYAVDEVILIDGERMLVVDIAANTLIVKRAWDGSTLAAHTQFTAVYASRSLTVTRGALGTTAAAHAGSAPVYRWEPPALVRDLVIAQAISGLTSETSGYTRAVRSGEGSSERNRDSGAVAALRQAVYDAVGRKARLRSV
ncbi:hypothetical protein [Streptomyces aureus]